MKRVISIVEDEKDINNLVAQYLRKEGYEVHSYYTYEAVSYTHLTLPTTSRV